jgi:hypothetical protein
MLSPQPGEDPMETVERLEERDEAATPDPVIAERNRRIADALIAMSSNYTESEIKFDVIAEQNGISVEKARAKHRCIELMEEGGVQLTLSDDHAWINFPYWDSAATNPRTVQAARRAAQGGGLGAGLGSRRASPGVAK